jgi:hypothetical protein
MKIEKKRFVKPEPKWETFCVGIQCDCCKILFEGVREEYRHSVNYHDNDYEVKTTGIFKVEGNVYPEGDFTPSTAWHICPKCFEEKVEPFLLSICGVIPQEKDND